MLGLGILFVTFGNPWAPNTHIQRVPKNLKLLDTLAPVKVPKARRALRFQSSINVIRKLAAAARFSMSVVVCTNQFFGLHHEGSCSLSLTVACDTTENE